jgi:hypothetical protein
MDKRSETGTVVLLTVEAVNPAGEEVASGRLEVLAPTVKQRLRT